MAEAPATRSPLAALADALAAARAGDVALAERPARARFNLRLDPADTGALDALAAVLGGALPLAPNTAADAGDGRTALWLGPDEWLLNAPAADDDALADALGAALDGRHHAVCDVSAMCATLALSGPHARDVLMKGVPPRSSREAFAPRCLRADDAGQGAGDPAHDRRRACLRDHRAQLLRPLPRHLAAGRHGGVSAG